MSAPIYVALADVARVCALTEHTLLTRYWPDDFGVPRDWRMVRSAVIVNEASLPELARTLEERGQPGTAAQLRRWIEANARPVAQAVAPGAPGGWLKVWEELHS